MSAGPVKPVQSISFHLIYAFIAQIRKIYISNLTLYIIKNNFETLENPNHFDTVHFLITCMCISYGILTLKLMYNFIIIIEIIVINFS